MGLIAKSCADKRYERARERRCGWRWMVSGGTGRMRGGRLGAGKKKLMEALPLQASINQHKN